MTSASLHAQVVDQDESETLLPIDKAKSPGAHLDLSAVTNLIVKQTNDFRQGEGLSMVEVNSNLGETAVAYRVSVRSLFNISLGPNVDDGHL